MVPTTPGVIKYNVFVGSAEGDAPYPINKTNIPMFLVGVDTLPGNVYSDIDSNLYYGSLGAYHADSSFGATVTDDEENSCAGPQKDFPDWNTLGWDGLSTIDVSPGFNDSANGDFSRPGASGEMNVTYGGKTHTIFGAIQNEAAPADSTKASMTGAAVLSGNAKLGDE
jgi:hypothetical protein